MPTHALVQTSFSVDSLLPRDRLVGTPCFRWASFTIQDAESLANNVLDAYETLGFPGMERTAKVYDLEGTPPVLPMATVTRHPGQPGTSLVPREIALCLSFAGGQFQPRQRGRLYLPAWWLTNDPATRPDSTMMQRVVDFGGELHDVGGANVDWIVWSRVNQSATAVTKWWCDDEWDTQRRRGLRPTTRITATG
jgi:hypothetical protein